MDRYTLTARLYPMLIFYIPLVILAIVFSFDIEKYYHYGFSIGLVAVLSYLMSHLGRDGGKLKEPALWSEWGGPPTTQLFRWRDTRLDIHTKRRYHSKMNVLCPTGHNVDAQQEANDNQAADEVYRAWTKYLLSQTRDVSKFGLLFRDNMGYGFRRNLWGLKISSIVLIAVLMLTTYIYFGFTISDWRIECMPIAFFIGQGLLMLIFLFWILLITKAWVKVAAYSYAERLHEAIDNL